ncbi:MAG: hypothetical protein GX585_03725 [Clostridiales bacterium]|nr:hypothetical protein [Clostridiales bacterium]
MELGTIREAVRDHLAAGGVNAVTAWPEERRLRGQAPVVVVSLRGYAGRTAGFQDYLGERYNTQEGRWEELYGRRVDITFGLDIYAPKGSGAEGCQAAFDRLAEVLHQNGPGGLNIRSLSCGETRYDREADLYHRPAEALCEAYLYAAADEGGAFLEFEVKGGTGN